MLKRILASFAAVLCAAGIAGALTISGTNTEWRNSIFQVGILRISRDEAITATASGTITTAYQLTAGLNKVTTVASGGDAVKLPITTPTSGAVPAGGGLMVVVVNAGANSLNIFPNQSADTINAGSAGAAYSLASGKTAACFAAADGTWYCLLSA